MKSRRRTLVLVVLPTAVLLAIALFIATWAPTAHQTMSRAFQPAREYVARAERREHQPADAVARPHDDRVTASRAADPAKRDALRRDIVRALEHRGVAAAQHPDDAAPPSSAGLRDHIGGHDELLARLNGDFLPLADECMDQARERRPDLTGLVAIDVELLAERDIGAIVETAEPADANTVDDAELVECLQQSLLSMALPGDAVDGRERFMISLRAEPDDDGAQ
jgi:hypothetical protein